MSNSKTVLGIVVACFLIAVSVVAYQLTQNRITLKGKVALGSKPCRNCGPIYTSKDNTSLRTNSKGEFFVTGLQENDKLTVYYGKREPFDVVCTLLVFPESRLEINALFANTLDNQRKGSAFQKADCNGTTHFPQLPPMPPMPPSFPGSNTQMPPMPPGANSRSSSPPATL